MIRKLVGLCTILSAIVVGLGLSDVMVLDPNGPQPSLSITEFMASNEHTLADQDEDPSDWIEIHNAETIAVDLDGWFLTDDRDNLTKWRFPNTTLAADGYLIVFASHKNRALTGSELHTNFRLDSSGEYLALVEPNGKTIACEYALQHLPQYEDVSYGLDAAQNGRYFTAPTPGARNGAAPADWGPILSAASHAPPLPTADDPLAVTVAVKGSLAPVNAVTLHYRVMYGNTMAIPMFDDGAHGDHAAQDGMYGAVIPNDAYQPGEMVRYYITATDAEDRTSRWPLFHDPIDSPEYLGTMIADPGSATLLPTLYWFVQDPAAAETSAGTRASVFYSSASPSIGSAQSDGVLYDNVLVRLRGYSAKRWPKKSLKFDFNQGHHLRFSPDQEPVEEINLNTTYSDKAYMRRVLAWETYRDVGLPSCTSFPMRVQQNGAFYGVFIFVEQPDKQYLERQGLDPDGAFYKIKHFNALTSATENVVKITRLDQGHEDLQALIDGIHLAGTARTNSLFDHVNVPAAINYQAAATVIQDQDQGHNNYYMYRDTEGTGEWMIVPWDKDLTFGLRYRGELSDIVAADEDPWSHPLSCYTENALIAALLDTPITREMFLRRLRTVMDERLQPPNTPVAGRHYERRVDQLFTQMQLDIVLDAARWPFAYGTPQTFTQAVERLKTDYLAVRRVHLYNTHGPGNGGIPGTDDRAGRLYARIPGAQPPATRLRFGTLGFAPLPGDQEYLTLTNPNPYAVDISNWTIAGPVEYTFQPGVVIPAGGTLYVSPDVVAFRTRAASPTGGEGHFVQGNYEGRLSNAGGLLRLYNADGKRVASKLFLDLGLFNTRP